MNSNSYEEQTRRLLSETKSELTNLHNQIAELQERAVILAKEVDAYETALQGYLRRAGKQTSIENDWAKLLDSAQTHKERIRLIAERKGGTVRASQVTDILYSKGFIKAKKRATAYSMVQVMLADMTKKGEFEKTGLGEYRLRDSQQSLIK